MTAPISLLLLALVVSALQAFAGRQQYAVLSSGDEATLEGTWSTGSGIVSTGGGFFNPRARSFTPPRVPGMAYSFTRDGFWEFAKYRIEANPRDPKCIQSQLIWQHGSYELFTNGSLILTPIAREGAQLLTSSCDGKSRPEEMYDVGEIYDKVDTWIDLHYGVSAAAIRLTDPYGNQSPSMWKIYDPPMMLPTSRLYLEYIGIP